jgi:hypothetical protein
MLSSPYIAQEKNPSVSRQVKPQNHVDIVVVSGRIKNSSEQL